MSVLHPSLALLRGKTALVTGAGGFIASRLCGLLRECGARVIGTSRWQQSLEGVDETIQLDLTSAAAVERALSQHHPDFVFHIAGVTSAARSLDMVRPTLEANLISTVSILEAAAKHRCERVVIAGSLEEPRVSAAGEITPTSPYAASKLAAACYGRMFFELFQVPVVMARIFMVYGPGQRDLQKLIPFVTTSLLKGEPPKLTSGRRPVDWVFVDDVARDLALAALLPGLEGKSLDIGTGTLTPVAAVAKRLGELMRSTVQPIFGEVADRVAEQVVAADVNARRRLLGNVETTSLDDGLQQTIDWYRQQLTKSP
jgi:nucleoside-diphosphate-sugar epimerase